MATIDCSTSVSLVAPTAQATTTRPANTQKRLAAAEEAIRNAGHAAPDLVIPDYDGRGAFFPEIPGFVCAECGAHRPGAGANRKSEAMISTPAGEIRRGGCCRTCKRVAAAAQRASRKAITTCMSEAGSDLHARRAVMQESMRRARLAMWTVYIQAAKRQMRRQQTSGQVAA